MNRVLSLRQRLRDNRAVAAIEFAVALPVFLMATLGLFDLSYEQYARSVLQGVVDKSARDGTLEGFAKDQTDLDAYIKRQVQAVWPGADVLIEREAFATFNNAGKRGKPEDFTDADGDGKWKKPECFVDSNGNGSYDKNRGKGKTGNGEANEIVLLTATISMDRIFPGWQLIGQPQEAEVEATMMLRNQPYAAGAEAPKMICGDGDDDSLLDDLLDDVL